MDMNTEVKTKKPSGGGTRARSGGSPRRPALETAYTYALLLCMGVGLGVISLYFASTDTPRLSALFGYFNVPLLPFLNILPAVLLIFALYFIFGRVWLAFSLGAAMIMTVTWVNYFKLLLRNDPLIAADIRLLWEASTIGSRYSIRPDWKIIAVAVFCAALSVGAFFFARRRVRSRTERICGLVAAFGVGLACWFSLYTDAELYARADNTALISAWERWSATKQYTSRGFLYPLLHSVTSARVLPPDGYDGEAEEELLADYAYDDIPDGKKVNIVAVMCEAFNDFSKFGGLEFTYDVYGPFHELEERSLSGQLITNVFAGGTVDTEWSFLTGFSAMNGEFRGDVNSYVRYLKEQGYAAEGSHTGNDWFYNRGNVNRYLGFDDYYFSENHYEELLGGTVDDGVLFSEIIALYEKHTASSDAPYFSFNVTFQNHGPYSDSVESFTEEYAANTGFSRESYVILNNYLKGAADTVRNVTAMADYFDGRDEPVLFVVFGDHNPWLGNGNSVYTELGIDFNFNDGHGFTDYYGVPYVVFANGAARRALGGAFTGDGGDLSPCFLFNEIFARAGFGGNEFMKAAGEVMARTPVLHTSGIYSIGGALTDSPPEDAREAIARFTRLQFYWRRNFRR
ncbi:MAG: LTA synthase family protein [Oscillospiraceae bacterium]|jgi:phosphoglycerol transferase MdoB-like AlkP superfamily enzyme|nr:LTA synthase family protein [Oscillospiraceae bacterium]